MIRLLQWLFWTCGLAGAAAGLAIILDGQTLYGLGAIGVSLGMILPAGNYFKVRRQLAKCLETRAA
jgi:hypothetical protein